MSVSFVGLHLGLIFNRGRGLFPGESEVMRADLGSAMYSCILQSHGSGLVTSLVDIHTSTAKLLVYGAKFDGYVAPSIVLNRSRVFVRNLRDRRRK